MELVRKIVEPLRAALRRFVVGVLQDELHATLDDVTWRMKQLYKDSELVPAEALNLMAHQITGYTITDNSPAAGSIAWTDVSIVYQGTTHGPFSGDTALKYVWFDKSAYDAAPTTYTLDTADTKPSLTKDDTLVFINDGGSASVAVSNNGSVHGAQLLGQSVKSDELAADSVIGTKILDGAVDDTKISDVNGGKIVDGTVSDIEISDVDGSKVNNGSLQSAKLNIAQHLIS